MTDGGTQDAKPSQCTSTPWIHAMIRTPHTAQLPLLDGPDNVGKWMIFRSTEQIDDVWEQIKTAVEDGMLGFEAKVSTCYEKRANAAHVICIYTYDHTNEIDVLRVREELRTMGFTEELGYKTNAATNAGIYQSTGHKKVCKYRC